MRTTATILLVLLLHFSCAAQNDSIHSSNRLCIGLGGESSFMGVDYSRNIFKQKLFLGVGLGPGTGITGYIRFEPVVWKGISPFISAGISYTAGGTIILSPGSSVLSSSAGLNYIPDLKWRCRPLIGLGATYYYLLSGDAEGGKLGSGPLIKIGICF